MLLIQLSGLSGSGKTTISYNTRRELENRGFKAEVIDGDVYRNGLCRDLGFSRADRIENIRRLGFVGDLLAGHGIVAILSAINPYEEAREALRQSSGRVRTVWIECDLETLRSRDTKGLYRRAFLPDSDPEKLTNLTGVNDPYEIPANPDLVIRTAIESEAESSDRLLQYILKEIGNNV